MAREEGFVALFAYADDFLSALAALKARSYRIETVFSPLMLPEVQEILGKKPSKVRLVTLLGGIVGGLSVVGLAVYAHLSFHLITGGKPVLPWIPWVVVCFEGTILGAVLFSVAAWILAGRLPRLRPAEGYDEAFSQDRFGIFVTCPPLGSEPLQKLLRDSGALEVRHLVR